MNCLYILDFDDTLFDTYGFYADVLVRLNQLHGLSVSVFASEEGIYQVGKLGRYDFYSHLRQHLQVTREQLKEQLIGQLPRATYVFADAARMLERLRQTSAEIVILTVGNHVWQQTKFDHAPEIRGIARQIILNSKGEYLSRMLEHPSATESKLPTLLSLEEYDEKFLVDDSIGNFEGLRLSHEIDLIRIRRPGAKHSGPPTPQGVREITSLDEL